MEKQLDPAAAKGQPWYADALLCLSCRHVGLAIGADAVTCPKCGAGWAVANGIPMLAGGPPEPKDRHTAIENAMRNFYEKNPFPTYDDFDTVGSLLDKARRSGYGQLLDDQIPYGARVLECGCGTGQLSTFLSLASRRCLGVDMCMASLTCGRNFKTRHGLKNVDFIQGNLFDLPVAEKSFDLVISKGVLHHTADARRAFGEIVKRVKPGGYVIVGLYNSYGRIPTWVRKQLFRVFGADSFGDHVMNKVIKSAEKRRIWWEDQYNNPHETWHSVDEVLRWFEEEKLEYVNAYPKINLAAEEGPARLFEKSRRGSQTEHVLTQLGWIFTISREGALFDMIARKPA